MKTLMSLAISLLLSTSLAAFAEDRDDRLARLQAAVGLSDEQVQQMREIREQGGSREEVRAVMTDEQRAKADELRASHRGGKKGGNFSRMQKHLDLSEEQMAEMRRIKEEGGTREEVHAVLTDEQREKLKAARNRHGGGSH